MTLLLETALQSIGQFSNDFFLSRIYYSNEHGNLSFVRSIVRSNEKKSNREHLP